jgi:hypothetical protein
MTDLRIDRAEDLTTVYLSGALTLARVPQVRGILLKCLVECPSAVLVDLTDLTADSDLPLVVFPTVIRCARDWPGAPPVLLYAPSGPLSHRIERQHLDRFLAVHESRERAVAALRPHGPVPAAVRRELPFGPEALRLARRLVRDACVRWEVPHLGTAAELIASELAGNALRHATPPLLLVAALRRAYLHLVVRDGSPVGPPHKAASPGDPLALAGDRGLKVVDAVATAWGWLRTEEGKAVWAVLRHSGRPDGDTPGDRSR